MTCCELAQALGSVSMQNDHSTVLRNLPRSKIIAEVRDTKILRWRMLLNFLIYSDKETIGHFSFFVIFSVTFSASTQLN